MVPIFLVAYLATKYFLEVMSLVIKKQETLSSTNLGLQLIWADELLSCSSSN